MAKQEKIFPDSTFGGRVQKLRHEKGLQRGELYEKLFPNTADTDPESKSRTIRNWESNTNAPDLDTLVKLCDILECDSDYLLGRTASHTTRKMAAACEITGLSEPAINILKCPCGVIDLFSLEHMRTYADAVNTIALQYPELLEDIDHIITCKSKNKDAFLAFAVKLYNFVDTGKKNIPFDSDVYNFVASYLLKMLSSHPLYNIEKQ